MDRENQIDKMREWFFENYGEPVNLLPYMSSEGGYIPIYGPLQYTDEILFSEYSDDVEEDIIKELIDELDELEQWSPLPDDTWFDDTVFYDTGIIIENALETLENIEKQISLVYKMSEYKGDFMRMLLAKVYATIESFLFDYAVNYSLENLEVALPILDDIPKLNKHPISFEEINKLKVSKSIEEDIDRLIKEKISHSFLSLIWHRFDDVRKIYKKFDFDIDITELKKYLYIRNDIVHRDGRRKEDMSNQHEVDSDLINKLITESRQVINILN